MTRAIILAGLFVAIGCRSGAESAAEEDPADWPWHRLWTTGYLSYRADVDWVAGAEKPLQAIFEMHNPSGASVFVETGPCGFGIRAYDRPRLSGRPVWDDRPQMGAACIDAALRLELPARSSESIPVHDLQRPAAAAMPPSGRYHFAVVFRDETGVRIVPAGEAEIAQKTLEDGSTLPDAGRD